jgi:transcriptional regulator with XRE-family HTH domain
MARPKIIDTHEQVTDRKVLAILVRTLRASLGWSQHDLAGKLGLTNTAIAKVETANIRLLPGNKARLLEVFEQAGAKFQFSPEGLTVSLGEEVLAKLLADEALGLRAALMADELVTAPKYRDID